MKNLSFISKENLKRHLTNTLLEYNETLKSMNLDKFNSNLIDPIKLLFDHKIYQKNFEEIINLEIFRQRDKTNTNAIGYFHQKIFQYIPNCSVPKAGFDIIYQDTSQNQTIYVELKNKHNTMNSSSALATYMKMQNQLLKDSKARCYLVEVIAKRSQNIIWSFTLKDGRYENDHIRRLSIDKFYEIVTGDPLAFYKLCNILPSIIDEILQEEQLLIYPHDTVIEELYKKDKSILKSLYLLAFETYEGF